MNEEVARAIREWIKGAYICSRCDLLSHGDVCVACGLPMLPPDDATPFGGVPSGEYGEQVSEQAAAVERWDRAARGARLVNVYLWCVAVWLVGSVPAGVLLGRVIAGPNRSRQ